MKDKSLIIRFPVQQRARARFAAILHALPQVLAEYGYAGVTTSRLAAAAGVGTSTVYDYFSCRDAVFVAYLRDRLAQALDQLVYGAVYSRKDSLLALRELVGIGVDFALQERPVIRAMVLHNPQLLLQIGLDGSHQKVMQLAAVFGASKRIRFQLSDNPLLIYSLENICIGFQMRLMMNDMPVERNQLVDELASIINAHIFRRPSH